MHGIFSRTTREDRGGRGGGFCLSFGPPPFNEKDDDVNDDDAVRERERERGEI